jgi:50S ribosomal protein L16 3-hydroxylase
MSPLQDSKLTLDDLVAPLSVTNFLGRFWQKRHYHALDATRLTDKLRAILGSFEVAHLLTLAKQITAFGYVAGRTDRREHVTAAQALDLYDRDYTLYISLAGSVPLDDFGANLARAAGISTVSHSCSVFASKTSGGLKTHFDQNENFTVQLSGSKVWTLWPNTLVDKPIHSYRRDEPLVDPDAGMYIDARARFADLGPGEDVVMAPGAILYHPRGSWHATRAASESISLNICLEPMTWYDVVLGAVSARLTSSAKLRTIVPALETAGDLEELARRAGGMVEAAQKALAELTPTEAAEACLAPPGLDADLFVMASRCKARITATSRLRRSSLAAIDVIRAHGETSIRVSLFLGRMTRHLTLRAPAELGAACERVAGPEWEWTPRKIAGDDAREDDLVQIARALSAVGAMQVVSGKR